MKSTGRVDSSELRALKTCRKDYPEAEVALLYRDGERLRVGEIRCLPVRDFLRNLAPNRGPLAWL